MTPAPSSSFIDPDRSKTTTSGEAPLVASPELATAVGEAAGDETASAALAPEFYEHFRKLMGDDLVLLIPDRFTIHVFPRPLGGYKDWGKKILQAYAEASHPVSYEVLLLNRDGLSVLGSFHTE